MSDVMVLTVLKFAGLAIALAATIWGMTRRTTFDDEAGRKRLTPAGHVAVALALGSFIVAGSSQGFETLARQAADQEAARSEEAKQARDFRNEQRGKRSLDLQLLNRAEALSQAAEARAARAEQRILTLKAAQAQRDRDLALSRQVGLGAQRNLERTGTALTQLGRLLQPIGKLEISITWSLPLQGLMPRLKEFLKRGQTDPSLFDGAKVRPLYHEGKLTGLEISDDSPLYPSRESEPEIHDLVASPTFVSLFKSMDLPEIIARNAGGGDVQFSLSPKSLYYFADTDELLAEYSDDDPFMTHNFGEISSVQDLDGSAIVVRKDLIYYECTDIPYKRCKSVENELTRRLRASVLPKDLTISTNGHTFTMNGEIKLATFGSFAGRLSGF